MNFVIFQVFVGESGENGMVSRPTFDLRSSTFLDNISCDISDNWTYYCRGFSSHDYSQPCPTLRVILLFLYTDNKLINCTEIKLCLFRNGGTKFASESAKVETIPQHLPFVLNDAAKTYIKNASEKAHV